MKTFILTLSIMCTVVISAFAQCTGTLTLSSPTDDVSSTTEVFQDVANIEASILITGNADVTFYGDENIVLQNGFYVEAGSQFLAKSDCVTPVTYIESTGAKITTFPNPVCDQLTVNLEYFDTNTIAYALTNANGKSVKTGKAQTNTFQISMKDLPSGMYLLTILADNKQATVKILR